VPLAFARRQALLGLRHVLASTPVFLCRDLRANKRPLALQFLQFLTRPRQAAVAEPRVSIPEDLVGVLVHAQPVLDLIVDELVFRHAPSPTPRPYGRPGLRHRPILPPPLRETISNQQVHVFVPLGASQSGKRPSPFFPRASFRLGVSKDRIRPRVTPGRADREHPGWPRAARRP
jgi:hypothetical protein